MKTETRGRKASTEIKEPRPYIKVSMEAGVKEEYERILSTMGAIPSKHAEMLVKNFVLENKEK